MSNRSAIRIRFAILVVFALFTSALILPNVSAQIRPGTTTRPGGITGRPITPNFPTGPTGPRFENVWTCEKCRKEVGRGSFPPATCPHCGVRLVNGIGNGDRPAVGGTGPNFPPAGNPGFQQPEPIGGVPAVAPNTELPPQPVYEPPTTSNSDEKRPAPGTTPPPATNSGPPITSVLLIVAGVIGGIMLLIVVGVAALVLISSRSGKKLKRSAQSRRRMPDEDDD